MAVWEMQIAFDIANHGIPGGAPVGTIARRPDGEWLAERKVSQSTGAGRWCYLKLGYPSTEAPLKANAADSWPVIYDPREGEAPQAEPCRSIDPVSELKCSQTLGHEGNHGTCSGLEWPDPTAQQVPETCRICNGSGVGYGKVPGGWLETDCAACDATGEAQQEPGESLARGLDDLATGRVSRRDDYLEPQQEPCCGVSEVFDCDCPPAVRGTVEDALRPDDVKLLETDPMEFVRRTQQEPSVYELDRLAMESIRTTAAQQEPVTARFSGVFTGTCMACQREQCDCHDNNDTPKPRTPRVVDRLGVDEQNAEWKRRGVSRDTYIWEYRFRNEVWQVRLVGNEVWASMSPGTEPTNGPFTEVLEPRVLPSLDCEEARDGTVWRDRDGDRCQYRAGLWWFVCDGPETWPIDLQGGRLTDYGPYVEVLS